MKTSLYRPRIIDEKMREYLSVFGAVCVEGPKWCGKTWTSAFHSRSEIFLGDPAGNFQNRSLAAMDPSLVLDGPTPRLIDEWQEVPPLWDAVRHQVDQRAEKGRFILTGSATPNHKGILHSGAGRIAKLRMRPMSLYESGDSSGQISLAALCRGELTAAATGAADLKRLIALIIRGGWPGNLGLSLKQAALLPVEYLNAVIDDDVFRIDGIRRDTAKMRLLLRSLARNESTTATNATLLRDMKAVEDEDINIQTVSAYLDILKRLFMTDDQPPFAARIRSTVRLRQAEKRHLADPSLACALLKATPTGLLHDLRTLGFLFEALCERDLRIYAEANGGALYHYQDYKGREVDAVIERADGQWCAFEIKLGVDQIDAAADRLKALSTEIAADADGRPPVVLGVICGMANAAYRRDDGVFVVPITALKN